MASQALDAYVKSLDPQKLYFLQSDIVEFNRRKADLADELKEGDIAIAYDVYRRYQQRVKEAEKLWKVLLKSDAGYDFDAREVVVVDPKSREYSKDDKVFREQWRLWLKYTLLSIKADPQTKDFELAKACEDLSASYARFARGVAIAKGHEVLDTFLSYVGSQYDNGTTYTSPATIEEYQSSMRGNFVGVGIYWKADGTISAIIPGGPAAKDGQLKPNDRIVSVGRDGPGVMSDITRLTQKEATALIRGSEGTSLAIGFKRPGEDRIRVITLKRGKVAREESKIEARIERVGAYKIGYLDLPNFYTDASSGESSATEVQKQLERFGEQRVDIVVLDLRRCSGGYLSETIKIAGLFIGQGPIIQVKNQAGEVQTRENENTKMAWDKPLAVLTGRTTAAGAEMVCAAIQDYKRGIVVGDDATYGMGSVRTETNLQDNLGFISVTTQQFYRINGEGVHLRGVKPDVVIPATSRTLSSGTASNFGFERVKAIEFQTQNMVSTDTILRLRASSRERRRASDDFKKLQDLIEWEEGQSVRAIETLNEKEYLNKLKALPTGEFPRSKPGETDYYLREVFAIASDYFEAIGSRKATPANIVKAPPPEDPGIARRRDLLNLRESAPIRGTARRRGTHRE